MSLQTKIYTYYFNIEKPKEREAYRELCERLTAQGLKVFASLSLDQLKNHSNPFHKYSGETVILETEHLFNNQWNTGPFAGSDKGWRVFDWAEDIFPNRRIKAGHYLEQTPEMKEIRRNTGKCRYCGKQEPLAKGYVFCPHCLDSEYLTEKDLNLTRMKAIDDESDCSELTQAEREHLLPLYREAQLHGSTERGNARIKKEREDIERKYQKETRTAKAEHDGLLWLLDHGVKIFNVIYYNHTEKFCFGWRKPLEPELKSHLLDLLCEFPFDYELRAQDRTTTKEGETMQCVNQREDGAFVADTRLTKGGSYTKDILKAKIYPSVEAARRDLCPESERTIALREFFNR